MLIERRYITAADLELRADGDAPPQVVGHAAVFDTLSEDLWGFRERIAPGAFADTIGRDDVRALFNHDPNLVLGRNRAGTLRLREDDVGLVSEIDPPDTSVGRDLLVSLRRGDVTQMSFGFIALEDDVATEDGVNVRTLRKVQLFDVSPVTFPAYPQTDVQVRSLEALAQEVATRAAAPAEQASAVAAAARRRRQLQLLELGD